MHFNGDPKLVTSMKGIGSLWEKGDEDDEVKDPDAVDDGDYCIITNMFRYLKWRCSLLSYVSSIKGTPLTLETAS